MNSTAIGPGTLAVSWVVAVFAATAAPVVLAPVLAVTMLAIAERLWCARRLSSISLHAVGAPLVVEGADRVTIALATRYAPRRLRMSLAIAGRAGEDVYGPAAPVGDRLLAPWERPGACIVERVRVTLLLDVVGLWPATQMRDVPVGHPVARGPRIGRSDSRRARRPDEMAALRLYRVGDRPSRVHWGATARTGTLHVRTDEDRGGEVVVVVDQAGAATTEDDAWLGAAGAAIVDFLEAGASVRMVTRERRPGSFDRDDTVIVDALCHDRDDVVRRLAAVAPGPALWHEADVRCGPGGIR